MITPELLERAAALPKAEQRHFYAELGKAEYETCARDPLYWLDATRHGGIPYVFTEETRGMFRCRLCGDNTPHMEIKRIDHLRAYHGFEACNMYEAEPHFEQLPYKRPFTLHEYIPPIVDAWLTYPFICWEKSRDMMATWTVLALYTWDTYFHPGRENIFQSEDAPKTMELVRRAWFMYDNQPRWLRDVHSARLIQGHAKSGDIRWKDINSKILGFPQGGDQIRMYHPTGLFQDEAAFQTKAVDAFGAVKPALQNGGRFTAVSTPNPSYFQLLVNDSERDLD